MDYETYLGEVRRIKEEVAATGGSPSARRLLISRHVREIGGFVGPAIIDHSIPDPLSPATPPETEPPVQLTPADSDTTTSTE